MSKGGLDNPGSYNPFAQQPQAPVAAPAPSGGGGFGGLLASIFGGGAPAPAPVAGGGAPTGSVGSSVAPGGFNPVTQPIEAAGQGYSPLRDPEGPLARAGWIGSLFATGPSKTEYLASLQQQQADAMGKIRGDAFKTLTGFVQAGETPQKAFLHFMNTPQGVDFVTHDPNPSEAISGFMKIATTPADPTADALAKVMGGEAGAGQAPVGGAPGAVPATTGPLAAPTGAVPGAPPAVGGLPVGDPAAGGNPSPQMAQAALAGDPAAGGATNPLAAGPTGSVAAPLGGDAPGTVASPSAFKPLTSGTGGTADSPEEDVKDPSKSAHWFDLTRKLMAVPVRKDADGKVDSRVHDAAQQAMEMGKTLLAQEQGKSTPDIAEYNAVSKQNAAMGVPTPSLAQWLLENNKSKAMTINNGTGDGLEIAQAKTRQEMDKMDYQTTYAPKAASARDMMSTLAEVSQYVDAPHGLAGVGAATLANWSGLLGIDVTPQMQAAQVMQALTAKMSAAFRPVGTGSTSDYEQKLFQSAVPGLMQDPASRKQMMLLANKFAQRTIDQAELLRDNVGDKNLSEMRKKLDATPILDKNDIETLKKFQGIGDAPAAPRPGAGAKTGDTMTGHDAAGKAVTLTFKDGIGWR